MTPPSLQPSSRPGQMTAVMRAVRVAAGPKVLRSALVHRGKVIDERTIARGAPLTVGPSERSTFVIADPKITAGFAVIAWSGEGYVLRVTPAMSGRVALASGMIDLEKVRPARESDGARSIALDEGARGKILIGESMILFHFVDPPAAAPRPHLPLAVQRGLMDDLDWKTTFIAAFSFLLHFGAVGSLYSDWNDTVIDDEVRVAQLIETMKTLPAAIPVEEIQPVDNTAKTASNEPRDNGTKDHGGGKPNPAPGHGGGTGGTTGNGKIGDTRAHEIASQLAAMDGIMVLGLNGPGHAIEGVLRDGNVPASMLDGVAASAAGVRPGDGTLHLGSTGGGGILHPGWHEGEGLPGNLVASNGPATAGSAAPVHKPVGTGTISPPIINGGTLPNAGGVVAAMRGGLRACYNRGLSEDPTMRGSVTIVAKIGPNGDVLSASPSGQSGSLSGSVVGCLAGRVKSAQFDPPSGGGATLVIPMKFESQ